jgi:hypothetical protein
MPLLTLWTQPRHCARSSSANLTVAPHLVVACVPLRHKYAVLQLVRRPLVPAKRELHRDCVLLIRAPRQQQLAIPDRRGYLQTLVAFGFVAISSRKAARWLSRRQRCYGTSLFTCDNISVDGQECANNPFTVRRDRTNIHARGCVATSEPAPVDSTSADHQRRWALAALLQTLTGPGGSAASRASGQNPDRFRRTCVGLEVCAGASLG